MKEIVKHGHFITKECDFPDKYWYPGSTRVELRIKGVRMYALYLPCSNELYMAKKDLGRTQEIISFLQGKKYQAYIRRKYNARQVFIPKCEIKLRVWQEDKVTHVTKNI
jgi:hypothetical protein